MTKSGTSDMMQWNWHFPSEVVFPLSSMTGGFPGGSVVKNLPANTRGTGGMGSIPGPGRSPGGGNGNSLQYSGWDNPMGRGTWWFIVHGVTKSQMWLKQLRTHTSQFGFSSPLGFPCGSAGKESACNVGHLGLVPGLGRFPGEGKGYPLQYSGLENSMDCIVHGIAKSDMTEWLSLHFIFEH